MKYILNLEEIGKEGIPLVGGKAANLGELLRMGYRVPPGFSITTTAYRDFLDAHGLQESIYEALVSCDLTSYVEVKKASREIQELIVMPELDPQLVEELIAAYQSLGALGVAIRSSATSEDLPNVSSAGQYDTFLNVLGVKPLLESVKQCWASLWSPRAIAYRHRRGMDGAATQMALAVQRMVPAEVSGVLFTMDPTLEGGNSMLINSIFGLGEGLVSGEVTPDRFLLDRGDFTVREQELGNKELLTEVHPQGGIRRVPLPPERREQFSLSTARLVELAGIGEQLEKHFGSPQDIEWAIHNGEVVILQSRPLTSLDVRVETSWDNPVPEAKWRRNWRLGEWLPDPVTPFFATTVLPWLVAGREKQGFGHLGWRAKKTFQMPEPWYIVVNGYFFTRADPPFRPSPAQPTLTDRAPQAVASTRRLRRWYRKHLPRYLDHVKALRTVDVSEVNSKGLLTLLDELGKDAGELWYILAPIGFGFEEFFFVPFYDDRVKGDDGPHYTTLFSGYDSKTLEGQRALYKIAQEIKTNNKILTLFQSETNDVLKKLAKSRKGEVLLSRFDAYLSNYGHQVYSLDFALPTLGERPDLALQSIRSYLTGNVLDPEGELERQDEERKRATTWAFRQIRKSTPEMAKAFRQVLTWHQLCASLREDITFYFQLGWPLMRVAALELGRRLMEASFLRRADEIFFLEKGEVLKAVTQLERSKNATSNLSEMAESRRLEWKRQQSLSPPDRIPPPPDPVWKDYMQGRTNYGLVSDAPGVRLVGQPGSPGQAKGRARVIRSLEEFGAFQQGEVLVAVATSPAWSVLFPFCAAIVTEVGGGATHCSIIAREYGIPCVMATGVATQIIKTGQWLQVDGTKGIVDVSPKDITREVQTLKD